MPCYERYATPPLIDDKMLFFADAAAADDAMPLRAATMMPLLPLRYCRYVMPLRRLYVFAPSRLRCRHADESPLPLLISRATCACATPPLFFSPLLIRYLLMPCLSLCALGYFRACATMMLLTFRHAAADTFIRVFSWGMLAVAAAYFSPLLIMLPRGVLLAFAAYDIAAADALRRCRVSC